MSCFTFFSCPLFETQKTFYAYSTSQVRLATFQVVNNHI